MSPEKKILLVEPPFYRLFKSTYGLVRYPLSLAYLATAIRAHLDWEVLACNGDFLSQSDPLEATFFHGEGFHNYRRNLRDTEGICWREIRKVVEDFRPTVVGISIKSSTFAAAVQVARIVKSINPGILVIAGGPHPTTAAEGTLACPDIDLCVLGEGEETIVELLQAIQRGGNLENVTGLAYRRGSDILRSGRRPPILDLDTLGFPYADAAAVLRDYDIYPQEAFRSVFSSRGCPYHCFFCGSREIWGRKVRFRSPGHVADEISQLRAMGVQEIHFDDDVFGATSANLKDLCRVLGKTNPLLNWSCEMHVGQAKNETLQMMKSANCTTVQVGIESGNNDILKGMRKGYTIEEAMAACTRIKQKGLGLQTFFMAGFPGETEKSLKDTLRAMEILDADKTIFSIFTPYPGTEAFHYCQKQGLIPADYEPSLYYHQSPENCFCETISPERFHMWVARLANLVVCKNAEKRLVMSASKLPCQS